MPLAAVDDLAPWRNRPLEQAQFGMGDNQFRVDFLLCAQAGTGGTGAMRTVKAEGARRDFGQADVIIDTGQFLRIQNLFTIDNRNQHDATTKFQCRLQRIGETLPESGIDFDISRLNLLSTQSDSSPV